MSLNVREKSKQMRALTIRSLRVELRLQHASLFSLPFRPSFNSKSPLVRMREGGWIFLSLSRWLVFRHEETRKRRRRRQRRTPSSSRWRTKNRQSALGFRWMEAERASVRRVCVRGLGNEVNSRLMMKCVRADESRGRIRSFCYILYQSKINSFA